MLAVHLGLVAFLPAPPTTAFSSSLNTPARRSATASVQLNLGMGEPEESVKAAALNLTGTETGIGCNREVPAWMSQTTSDSGHQNGTVRARKRCFFVSETVFFTTVLDIFGCARGAGSQRAQPGARSCRSPRESAAGLK